MLTNGMIQSNNNDENNKDDDEMCFYMSKRKKRLTMTSCQDRDLNQVSNSYFPILYNVFHHFFFFFAI